MSSPFSFDSLIQFFLSYHLSMIADRLSLLSIRTLPIKHFRLKQCLSASLAPSPFAMPRTIHSHF